MAKSVYHASPEQIEEFEPRDWHGDPDVGKAVFATPHLQMALAYAGKKWGDRDIDQGSRGGKGWHLREMRPGAFADIYPEDSEGYLYELDADKFRRPDRSLGSDFEVISEEAVKPTKVRKLKNVLKRLREAGVKLERYDPESENHKAAVQRMAARASKMEPEAFEKYLKWVAETNPELEKQVRAQAKTAADEQPEISDYDPEVHAELIKALDDRAYGERLPEDAYKLKGFVSGGENPQGYILYGPWFGANHIRSVAVDPEHQGKGLGTTLLRKVLEDVEGPHTLAVQSNDDDFEKRKKLYERLGFADTGKKTNWGHPLYRREAKTAAVRYEADGKGVYEAAKAYLGKKRWKELLAKLQEDDFLPQPPAGRGRYWFTERGDAAFQKGHLPLLKKVLGNRIKKRRAARLNTDYADPMQVREAYDPPMGIKTAADDRPYRDRVEAFAVDDEGNVYGGRYEKDRTFGVFGGGVDPGETPEQAGAREFMEESGHDLLDAESAGIDPVTHEWSPPYVSEKQKERAKKFRGSRTHFIIGRKGPLSKGLRGEDIESNLLEIGGYEPAKARQMIRRYLAKQRGKSEGRNPTLRARAAVLTKILQRRKRR